MANPLRKLQFKEQSQGKRIGGDEPPQASMRKSKPGRTKPSSQVKKIKKKSGGYFIRNPRPMEEYEDFTPDHQIPEQQEQVRGKQTRKRVIRKNDAEYSRDSAARQGVLDGRYERGTPPKINANDIYYRLRENLSPANARLLDILAGKGGPGFQEGTRVYSDKEMKEMIPF